VPPTALVVALHGHQDEPDELHQRLAALVAPHRAVLTPRSSFELDGAPVWFRTADDGPVEAELVASVARLEGDIADACAAGGFGRDQVVVGGFSQGGAVALALALADGGGDTPLAGVFSVSGWLPHAASIAYDAAALASGRTRALVVHGDDDPVVPVQQGRSAARYLERHGVTVRYVEHEGGHHLGPVAVADLADWLEA
jgi:phospholipase/carboxylesterase